jgi:hypothetical protein
MSSTITLVLVQEPIGSKLALQKVAVLVTLSMHVRRNFEVYHDISRLLCHVSVTISGNVNEIIKY